jgi:prepilin-type N-terminal cleavage/methylation domain-containing protein
MAFTAMTQRLLKESGSWGPANLGRGIRGRSAGFTLVEIVLVVMIISVVAGIAVPRYANALHRYRADIAAQRIVADVTLVQASARASGETKTLTFDVRGNTYQLPADPGLARLENGYTIRLGLTPYQATLVSADFGGGPSVSFNGFGIPSGGGRIVVSAGENVRTIVVDASTGAAVIQ